MPNFINEIYDIEKAFQSIENELMASMMRKMKRHRAWEDDERFRWSQWQVEQLKALEKYKLDNRNKFTSRFSDINKQIVTIISSARQEGGMDQEIAILKAIKNGHLAKKAGKSLNTTGEFFRLNTRKLDALTKATKDDFAKAEFAMLRQADDQYRKIIFNAQMYANSGAGTYAKAVDMATKDFLSRGITCIEYKNGARHTMSDYASMCLRTASKRAYLTGEGEKRMEWGEHLVILNKRGNACPLCLPFVGKILIDDVWSGGSRADGPYPLMSDAIKAGLYHPNCKDGHTTYFPELEDIEEEYSRKEVKQVQQEYNEKQQEQYASRQAEKYGRLEKYSLDPDNKNVYGIRKEQWANKFNNVRFKTGGMDSHEYVEGKRPLANFQPLKQEEVVNVLRQESDEWISTLTNEEKYAINKYTFNSGDKKPNRFFERINAMLRGDLPEDKKLRTYADTISGVLKKNRIKQDVICYRNTNVNPVIDSIVGDIVSLDQFVSTSVVPEGVIKGNYEIIIYAPKGTHGAYIEELSVFKKQRELLLDKDCIYRVISNKGNKIELEVRP